MGQTNLLLRHPNLLHDLHHLVLFQCRPVHHHLLTDFPTNVHSALASPRLSLPIVEDELKAKVLIKNEIVAWGISKKEYDMKKTGQHLNAQEFNNLIDEEDTLLIDMRNSYESEVG